ncbi:hypothetical protein GQ53DRAFT_808700 [Thozetella sp. PMI_491]|nr:hypothetical protein GQ53DRAFT_808700 [Thozetella sp. PMI_491]
MHTFTITTFLLAAFSGVAIACNPGEKSCGNLQGPSRGGSDILQCNAQGTGFELVQSCNGGCCGVDTASRTPSCGPCTPPTPPLRSAAACISLLSALPACFCLLHKTIWLNTLASSIVMNRAADSPRWRVNLGSFWKTVWSSILIYLAIAYSIIWDRPPEKAKTQMSYRFSRRGEAARPARDFQGVAAARRKQVLIQGLIERTPADPGVGTSPPVLVQVKEVGGQASVVLYSPSTEYQAQLVKAIETSKDIGMHGTKGSGPALYTRNELEGRSDVREIGQQESTSAALEMGPSTGEETITLTDV